MPKKVQIDNYCTKHMVNGPCGRELLPGALSVDSVPACIMHATDAHKDTELFQSEVNAILRGRKGIPSSPATHRASDRFDFTGFVFPKHTFFDGFPETKQKAFQRPVDFSFCLFLSNCDFAYVHFEHEAYFREATFAEGATFHAAHFLEDAYFDHTNLLGTTSFQGTRFKRGVEFKYAAFGRPTDLHPGLLNLLKSDIKDSVVDFRSAQFEKPDASVFEGINVRNKEGVKVRFSGCRALPKLRFEGVNWYRKAGRIALQDELDLEKKTTQEDDPILRELSPELVAITYRRLISNFESARDYGSAEDAFIGLMEVKASDPHQPFLTRVAIRIYRAASTYGSNYGRAFLVLIVLQLFFGLTYVVCSNIAAEGLAWDSGRFTLDWWKKAIALLTDGLIYSMRVSTFQTGMMNSANNVIREIISLLQRVIIAGQFALLLLALRRRFRR